MSSNDISITFKQSGRTIPWDDDTESILVFAEDYDIEIDRGCLFGDCGTCMTKLLSGEVEYNHKTSIEPDAGHCLPCSCKPTTSITLDV